MFSSVEECLFFFGLKTENNPVELDENLDLYFFIDPRKLTSLLNKYI